jgi:hypothetical protein
VYNLAESHWSSGDLERFAALDFRAAQKHYDKAVELLRRLEKSGRLGQFPVGVKMLPAVIGRSAFCQSIQAVMKEPAASEKFPDNEAFEYLMWGAKSWASKGDAAKVASIAGAIQRRWDQPGYQLHGVAKCFALASSVAATPADRERYTVVAWKSLDAATRAGIPAQEIARVVATDPDFAALRTIPPAVD